MSTTFKALVISKTEDAGFTRQIETHSIDDLPEGDVLIKVHYSSLNYKDGLSATGSPGVTKSYPHTPGVDAAGVVEASTSADFQVGDEVIVTGYDLGMDTAGGFGGFIRVPASWVIGLPTGLTLKESMIYGTAGFTAALCVLKLEQMGVTPDQGEILVTGATGGVGSFAVGILAQAGYTVVAATGKPEAADYLTQLGASRIVSREDVTDDSKRPMLRGLWAGAVDTVGGDMLATVLKATKYGGSVACCGLVGSPKLSMTVLPFILRNINLLGVDSVTLDMETRLKTWPKLGQEWKLPHLDSIAQMRSLEELDAEIERIMGGQQVGRVVVDLQA
ncbi:MAG: YhdH/YhfP family quinone oxidoreductase [Chloroflexota bacterium]